MLGQSDVMSSSSVAGRVGGAAGLVAAGLIGWPVSGNQALNNRSNSSNRSNRPVTD